MNLTSRWSSVHNDWDIILPWIILCLDIVRPGQTQAFKSDIKKTIVGWNPLEKGGEYNKNERKNIKDRSEIAKCKFLRAKICARIIGADFFIFCIFFHNLKKNWYFDEHRYKDDSNQCFVLVMY